MRVWDRWPTAGQLAEMNDQQRANWAEFRHRHDTDPEAAHDWAVEKTMAALRMTNPPLDQEVLRVLENLRSFPQEET